MTNPATPSQELRLYNARDNVMQYKLALRLKKRLKALPNGQRIFDEMTALGRIADEMTWRGVRVDAERQAYHHQALRTRVGKALAELRKATAVLSMPDFNPKSHQQVKKLFFKELSVRPTKYSELTGEPSCDEEVLTQLVSHSSPLVRVCAQQMLRIRKWDLMDRNFVMGLRCEKRGNTHIAHPFWRPGGAISGRWSSSNPNVLNIPKPVWQPVLNLDGTQAYYRRGVRAGQPKKRLAHAGLRDMFIPHDDDGVIVEADYKQIELRIVALLAGDQPLLETFAAGRDPHSANAKDLFGIRGREPTGKERTLAKNFVYLANYGGDTEKLWQTILPSFPGFTVDQARRMLDAWFDAHPAIADWQYAQLAAARKTGSIVEPLSGRTRYFWGPVQPTEVYNFPVQTAASYVINRAIHNVNEALRWPKEGILFQYHDALIVDGRKPFRLGEILQNGMNIEVELNGQSTRFPVDLAVGRSWGTTEEVSLRDL